MTSGPLTHECPAAQHHRVPFSLCAHSCYSRYAGYSIFTHIISVVTSQCCVKTMMHRRLHILCIIAFECCTISKRCIEYTQISTGNSLATILNCTVDCFSSHLQTSIHPHLVLCLCSRWTVKFWIQVSCTYP